MQALQVMRKWEGKEKFYKMLMERGTLGEELYPINLGPFGVYLECFYELSTCRSTGFGVGPIPVTAIHSYADKFGLSYFFCRVIRALDLLYLNDIDKKKKDTKKESL